MIAKINPLSYQVDLLRALMIQGGQSTFGLGVDFAVQLGMLAVLVGLAAKLYPRIVT